MRTTAHPYMANSVRELKEEMLDAIGAASIEELFAQIPETHRVKGSLELPPALASEVELARHLRQVLSRNVDCERNLSFLGAGCWPHYVPAVCDEIVRRSEFLTPVWGTPSSDFGRNQAWFEFCSQLGELLDLEFVGLPVYSWGCAAGHAVRMASRLTGRRELLVPRSIDPERLAVIRTYCELPGMPGHISVREVAYDPASGRVDLDDLRAKLSEDTCAVYLETPTFLGVIEAQASDVAHLAHDVGAEVVAGVDPVSLGVLAPPGAWGADIAVGPIQPLGVHMNCGGGVGGFIASRDEERYARQYPTLNLTICDTIVPGERSFAVFLFHQTSYGSREEGNDWTGNSTYLWAIAAAAYMALLGPQGFTELGALILQRSRYAAAVLDEIDGVSVRWRDGFFKEFVVTFEQPVAEVNRRLLERGIFGGKDLSRDFPELGNAALYCVTEMHTKEDIDRLATALEEVTRR
ncbi:MAG TPA: aminomethyl-transferring glycine dehydrogenase subunit GcvPA [Gaiellaceae bacterium]|nr:aminomethyl-transferring glycine dehydrogenase subunit GcvPA [Gaiellaceae bacterium]